MLKNFGYGGAYRDQDISVGILLENPLDHGLDAARLAFSVTIRNRRSDIPNSCIEDFSFYIMDEQNRVYNTQKMPGHRPGAFTPKDGESNCVLSDLIFTDLRPEFLFQDLRIVFYEEAGQQFHIIRLKH